MTQANFRIDRQTKSGAHIPFEINKDPFYSESNISHIQNSIRQLEDGKTIIKSIEELEELAGNG